MLAARVPRSCGPSARPAKCRQEIRRFASASPWNLVKEGALDENHATAHAFDAVNLGRGVYKDDNGKDYVLSCVRKAEERILKDTKLNHGYLAYNGLKEFTTATSQFAFGKGSALLKDQKVATVQSISGTGALRVGAEFVRANLSRPLIVYLPEPTYIFQMSGFELRRYRYYDPKTKGLDFKGMSEDLRNAPSGAVVLLHACAHNPTGVDPSLEQWKRLSGICKEKDLLCFFDSAYQGFASGDPDRDAAAFRLFADVRRSQYYNRVLRKIDLQAFLKTPDGHFVIVAQSYAKNFGLYGQRIGALNVVTSSADETKRVMSRLNLVIRPMYSNPPLHGARVVANVFNDPELTALWRTEVKGMADRISSMRRALVDSLKQLGNKRSWSHITDQIGMFAYSGLSRDEVQALREHHVYLNYDGRMSITGVNSHNVQYLANAMHKVTSV